MLEIEIELICNVVVKSVVGIILAALIGEIVKDLYFNYKGRIKERNNQFAWEWIPTASVKNSSQDIKKIDDYPKDFPINKEEGRIGSEKIEGLDCFKMHLAKLINTEKDKYKIYQEYGVSYLFKNATDRDEFIQYSITNSQDIMKTFDEWIREIFYIKKYKDKNYLQIGLGLKGRNEIVRLDIPLGKQKEI